MMSRYKGEEGCLMFPKRQCWIPVFRRMTALTLISPEILMDILMTLGAFITRNIKFVKFFFSFAQMTLSAIQIPMHKGQGEIGIRAMIKFHVLRQGDPVFRTVTIQTTRFWTVLRINC